MPGRSLIRFFGTRSAAGLEVSNRQVGSGSSSSNSCDGKRQEPGNRFRFGPTVQLRNGEKSMRASAVADPGLPQVRISAESIALELRGIVTSWSSEQEHAMSGTA